MARAFICVSELVQRSDEESVAMARVGDQRHAVLHKMETLCAKPDASVRVSKLAHRFTNGAGSSWLHSDGSYLASNGRLHGGMLRLLRAALPEHQPSA